MKRVNDYDHYAATRQEELKNGTKFSHYFVEKPAMEQLLPDLTGKHVLMLGCGTGEESVLLEAFGATEMIGIDLSQESVNLAKKSYPKHDFSVGDMHSLRFEDSTFDFVYSSLAIHYSQEPQKIYEEIFRVLKPGGAVQFSLAHPMRWASERIELNGVKTKVLGYSESGQEPRLYGSYSAFAQYDETFPDGEVLSFWVGPPSFHFTLLRTVGFNVEAFVETKTTEECRSVKLYYYERCSNFPQFTVFVARKAS